MTAEIVAVQEGCDPRLFTREYKRLEWGCAKLAAAPKELSNHGTRLCRMAIQDSMDF